jgi:hypothetical protein
VSQTRGAVLDLRELRWVGLGMLGAGILLPAVGHPGIACPFRTLTGIPCPLCGMSTSVEDSLHLHLGDALAANPVGILLALAALALLVVRPTRRVNVAWPVVILALAVSWIFELFRFSVV